MVGSSVVLSCTVQQYLIVERSSFVLTNHFVLMYLAYVCLLAQHFLETEGFCIKYQGAGNTRSYPPKAA